MDRSTYYVNLNPISMNNISPTRVNDGQLIEYEITATESELKALKELLDEVQAHDMELANLFTFKHFDETNADIDRNETQAGLNEVYQKLYELGTPQTKQAIEEIQLQNDHSTSTEDGFIHPNFIDH